MEQNLHASTPSFSFDMVQFQEEGYIDFLAQPDGLALDQKEDTFTPQPMSPPPEPIYMDKMLEVDKTNEPQTPQVEYMKASNQGSPLQTKALPPMQNTSPENGKKMATSAIPGRLELETLINSWINEKGVNIPKRRSGEFEERDLENLQPDNPSSSTTSTSSNVKPTNIRIPKLEGDGEIHITTSSSTLINDLNTLSVKSQLMEIMAVEKDVNKWCKLVLDYLADYLKAEIGGFYLNENQTLRDWVLCSAYPSLQYFSDYFQFNTGYHLILQAAMQRFCFSVNTTDERFCYLFVPVFAETSASNNVGVGVMVFGMYLKGKDKKWCLNFLDQLRSPIASSLRNIQLEAQYNGMRETVKGLQAESEKWKQTDFFNRSLVMILASMVPAALIVTNAKGSIIYMSKGALNLFLYPQNELIGRSPIKLFHPKDIADRAKQLEIERGKKLTGFDILAEYPQVGIPETRKWNIVKRNGDTTEVQTTTKAIFDSKHKVLGYVITIKGFK